MSTEKEEIIESIYRYLPKDVDPIQEEYWQFPEIHRLQAICQDGGGLSSAWATLIDCLQVSLKGNVVVDWTFFSCLDRCYRLTILLSNDADFIEVLVVNISIIVPYWSAYLMRKDVDNSHSPKTYHNTRISYDLTSPSVALVFKEVTGCVQKLFSIRYLTKEIGLSIVPNLTLERTPVNQVNIFQAIFTDLTL